MPLNEIRVAPVPIEAVIGDRDALQHDGAARLEQAAEPVEIDRPPGLAHGLQHLDRDDAVELPLTQPVVLQPELGAIRQTGRFQPRRRVGVLRGRQCQAGGMDAPP